MREALHRLQEIFLLDTRPNEFASGWLAFGWGLFILFPPGNNKSAALDAMEQTAPLWLWGTLIGLIGITQIVGSAFRLTRLRTVSSFLIAPFWTYVTVLILLSGNASAGFYAYALFAGMCSWAYIRLAGDGVKRVIVVVRPRVSGKKNERK